MADLVLPALAALPGARHDMGAAREHGLLDALNAACGCQKSGLRR
jgi:hypothetical protein